jgi:hypothetical protein
MNGSSSTSLDYATISLSCLGGSKPSNQGNKDKDGGCNLPKMLCKHNSVNVINILVCLGETEVCHNLKTNRKSNNRVQEAYTKEPDSKTIRLLFYRMFF